MSIAAPTAVGTKYSFVLRHAEKPELETNAERRKVLEGRKSEAQEVIREYLKPSPIAEKYCKDWLQLLNCDATAKVQKLLYAHWTERSHMAEAGVDRLLGHVACAWVTSDFIRYAEERATRGEPSFLHEYKEEKGVDPVLAADIVAEYNSNDGVQLWFLFYARRNRPTLERLDPNLPQLLRQKLFAAAEEELVGWNIKSIHAQVFGDDYEGVARAYGFERCNPSASTDLRLMRARKQDRPVFDEAQVIWRYFSWKQPIYGLKEEEKRLLLVMMTRDLDVADTGKHLRKRGLPLTGKDEYDLVASIKAKVNQVHPYLNLVKGKDCVEHFRQNMWELRPTVQLTAQEKSSGNNSRRRFSVRS